TFKFNQVIKKRYRMTIIKKARLVGIVFLALTLSALFASELARAQSSAATRSTASTPNTLADLRSRINEIVHQPALEPGFFAVKIVSLDTNEIIFEQNANKFVRPASNMKLYTVTAALDRLTPDFHFVTSVYAKDKPDK